MEKARSASDAGRYSERMAQRPERHSTGSGRFCMTVHAEAREGLSLAPWIHRSRGSNTAGRKLEKSR